MNQLWTSLKPWALRFVATVGIAAGSAAWTAGTAAAKQYFHDNPIPIAAGFGGLSAGAAFFVRSHREN